MDLIDPTQLVKLCPACGQQFAMEESHCPLDQCELISRFAEQLAGSIFDQNYRIMKTIGSGGTGWVYQAMHKERGQIVALKVLHIGLIDNETATERFKREAQALIGLNHPNIVKVHESNITAVGQPYLVMNFLEGSPLDKLVSASGAVPAVRAIKIFEHLSNALAYAHDKGIVHRDLKPNNIILQVGTDNTDKAIIVDFGIAKLMPEFDANLQKLTSTGQAFGTPNFMSPEQWRGGKIDARSDIYAFGALMYESITGVPPYDIETMVAVMLDGDPAVPLAPGERNLDLELSEEFEAMILKALRINIDERYQSIDELRRDLTCTPEFKQTQDEGITSSARKNFHPARKIKREFKRHQLLTAISCLLLVLVAIVASASFTLSAKGGIELTQLALSLPVPNSRVVALRSHLADLYFQHGRFDESFTEYKRLLEEYKPLFSSRNISSSRRTFIELEIFQRLAVAASKVSARQNDVAPYTVLAISSFEKLADAYARRKQLDKAIAFLKESVRFEEQFPDSFASTKARALIQLCYWEEERGILSKNEQFFRDAKADFLAALPLMSKCPEAEQLDHGLTFINMGKTYFDRSRFADAELWLKEGIAIVDSHPGVSAQRKDETLSSGLAVMARLKLQKHKFEDSRKLWERVLQSAEKRADEIQRADALFEIGNCLGFEFQNAKAETYFRKSLAIREKVLGPSDYFTGIALLSLGSCLFAQYKDVEAIACLDRSIKIFQKCPDQAAVRPQLNQALKLSVTPLERTGRKAELSKRLDELKAFDNQE